MLVLKKCSFCSRDFGIGTGIMYIANDGSSKWFCSSKCRKNGMKLGRDARKLKWARGPEMRAVKKAEGGAKEEETREEEKARAEEKDEGTGKGEAGEERAAEGKEEARKEGGK